MRICRASLCAMAVLLAALPAAGQIPTAGSALSVPLAGEYLVETEISAYRVNAFVGAGGDRQTFPGQMQFTTGFLRIAYAPVRRFAFGLLVPYRFAAYNEIGLDTSFGSSGITGLGAFLEWTAPSLRTVQPTVRLEYFRARPDADGVLTFSDGVDRMAATFQLSRQAEAPAAWRALGNLRVEYGPPADGQRSLIESNIQFQAGPRIARIQGGDVHLLGVAGYRVASLARQEGNFFHNRTSQGAVAGLLLSWDVPYPRAPSISVSLLRDVRTRNALSGWRLGFSLASRF